MEKEKRADPKETEGGPWHKTPPWKGVGYWHGVSPGKDVRFLESKGTVYTVGPAGNLVRKNKKMTKKQRRRERGRV